MYGAILSMEVLLILSALYVHNICPTLVERINNKNIFFLRIYIFFCTFVAYLEQGIQLTTII